MNEYELITKSDFDKKILIYLDDAIKRHPFFAKDYNSALCIIMEEVGELAQSLNDGDINNARVELFHCIATLLRLQGMFLHYDEIVKNTNEYLRKGAKCGKN